MTDLDRRTFLAACAAAPLARLPRGETRTLVLLQLSGGNDGLSTVVPYADDAYRRVRDTTRHRRKDLHVLDDARGLHGALTGLAQRWEDGGLAIIEGAGYPDMVRSHFKALEIWHTADARGRTAGDGWVGRMAAGVWAEEDHPELVVHLGTRAPWSVRSRTHPAVTMVAPTTYRWFGGAAEQGAYAMAGEPEDMDTEARHAGRDAALTRLRGVLDDARTSSRRVRAAAEAHGPRVQYPRTRTAAKLRDAAALIRGGLAARVISVEMTGYDTHANQRPQHDGRMTELDGALDAFLADVAGTETAVLVFSEFGRRVAENASAGTDHGKAGPAFLVGAGVRGGLYGAPPDLSELDGGDVPWTTDFRCVYGEVVEGWFGAPMESVLGARYPRLDVFRPR